MFDIYSCPRADCPYKLTYPPDRQDVYAPLGNPAHRECKECDCKASTDARGACPPKDAPGAWKSIGSLAQSLVRGTE